ncbi:MAG: cytochrome c oxidase subunit 3 [Rhodospirillales bacterium]|nr:cytochrome c oxidase subunit 3 [Rhodospirillales bacterium]
MSENIEYGTTGKPHPFHIVRPSPWPLAGAFAGGLLAVGLVAYMHGAQIGGVDVGLKGVALGVLSILAVMFFWWRDVVRESVVERVHTPDTERGLRMGMALFIASEVMFFVAFFWAFFDSSIFVGDTNQYLRLEYSGGTWPPARIEDVVPPFGLPFLMTMILLLSGCTVTWAHHAVREGKNSDVIKAIGLTAALGFIFLCFQAYEYAHALKHFGFKDGAYPSTFYMATGFHGFHVFIGSVFLVVCWVRAIKGQFTPDRHFGLEAAAWYWHFVDVVWLFLFVAIYWWGNGIGIQAAQ